MFNFSARSFVLALSSQISPSREMKHYPQSSLYTGHIFKLLAATLLLIKTASLRSVKQPLQQVLAEEETVNRTYTADYQFNNLRLPI